VGLNQLSNAMAGVLGEETRSTLLAIEQQLSSSGFIRYTGNGGWPHWRAGVTCKQCAGPQGRDPRVPVRLWHVKNAHGRPFTASGRLCVSIPSTGLTIIRGVQ